MLLLDGKIPEPFPGVFAQHVLANGVNECSEALRLPNAPLSPKRGDHSSECLLANVIHPFGGEVPCSQHDAQELPKIGYKVLLCRRISVPQTIYI